nr:M66 family metalloprotease [uncultured Moellerella sp.]
MDNPKINNKSKQKSVSKTLDYSFKNTLMANRLAQHIDKIDIETQLEKPLYYIKKTNDNSTSASLFNTSQGGIIGLANLYQQGRIATMGSRELFELGLNKDNSDGPLGRVLFDLFSWLIDKPRVPGKNEKSYILNLTKQFFTHLNKSPIATNHNLYIDNFNSPHQWKDGEIQSVQQIEDALLPTGQWHRHYSCVLLPANANDLQVKLIRHWLEKTNGSLVIIFDETITPSKYIIELLNDSQLTLQSTPLPPPKTIKSIEEKGKLTGLSLKISPLDQQNSFLATKLIVPQLNYNQVPIEIKNISQSLLWSYKGFIELPEKGTFILGADTKKNDQITIQIGQQIIKLDGNNSFQAIKQKNFTPKSKIAINIKVKTKGEVPSLRLFWLRPNMTKYELLPQNLLSHDAAITAKPRKTRYIMTQTKPAMEISSQHPFHQIIQLPEIYTKRLLITNDIAAKANSFSIKIIDKDNNKIVDVRDIKLAKVASGEDLARKLEKNIKQLLPSPYNIRVNYLNNKLKINASDNLLLDNLVIYHNPKKYLHIENYQLPLIYAQTNEKYPNTLVMGAIQGDLPFQPQTLSYDLIEAPQFGHVTLNKKTGKWSYQPHSNEIFKGFDQFQFQAIGKKGKKLPPIGVSLQSKRPPLVSIPGKKIFTIPDPIYAEPLLRYQPIPLDMKVHDIYLAQTHLLKPDNPYLSLAAKRWVLIKVDATSQSSAKSPDFVAIIKDKEGQELGRVTLKGPEYLPSTLADKPKTAEISRQDYDINSYSAPIKSAWIKPGIQIQIIANNKPIIMPYSDKTGHFSPNVQLDQHTISRLWNHSYYQTSQGVYPYSMLSWGKEALAKLPISQLTLYSHPANSIEPTLFKSNTQPIHPAYASIDTLSKLQSDHTYDHSFKSQTANGLQKEITYTARYSKYGNSILGLGAVGAGYGSGVTVSSVLWHESFGHGLGFDHTSDISSKTTGKEYPYDNKTNGTNFAFDQINDVYLTHHYIDPQSDQYKPMAPSMYPYHNDDGKRPYAAFKPHSDYHTHKANQYFIKQLRWQPNGKKGIDSEDNEFAGDGYYQRWNSKINDWITLSANNVSQYYSAEQINNLAHQREVPVYWLSGNFTQYNGQRLVPDRELYPLSQLNIIRTIGNLPADYYNFQTEQGRPYNPYQPYALKIIYSTASGLLTDILQLPYNTSLNQLGINIPDKGEITQIELLKIEKNKKLSNPIYTYLNPEALANIVFSKIATKNILILPNYWRGNKLFWAITDDQLINKSTGKIDSKNVKSDSAIKASWIEKGKYHQRIFSLDNMEKPFDLNKITLNFHPLNNHKQLYRSNKQGTIHSQDILTESELISGTHINEYINIPADLLPEDALYWVKLLWNDNGKLTETDPLESWYIYQQENKLVINGVVDSTPEIELAGLRIYSDVQLLDKHTATSINLYQKSFFERYLSAQAKKPESHDTAERYAPLYERSELFDMSERTGGEMGLQTHQPSITSQLLAPILAVG